MFKVMVKHLHIWEFHDLPTPNIIWVLKPRRTWWIWYV